MEHVKKCYSSKLVVVVEVSSISSDDKSIKTSFLNDFFLFYVVANLYKFYFYENALFRQQSPAWFYLDFSATASYIMFHCAIIQ